MLRSPASYVPQIVLPYRRTIGVLDDFVTWKVIHVGCALAHSWATALSSDLAHVLATTMSIVENVFIKGTGETVTTT